MNEEREFRIESSATAPCTPEAVGDRLLRPETWPDWQSEIVSVDRSGRLEPRDVVQGRARMLGFDVTGQAVMTETSEARVSQDVVVGVGMHIDYRIERTTEGVRITHTLTSGLPKGPAGHVLAWFLRWRLRRMQRDLLRALVDQLGAS